MVYKMDSPLNEKYDNENIVEFDDQLEENNDHSKRTNDPLSAIVRTHGNPIEITGCQRLMTLVMETSPSTSASLVDSMAANSQQSYLSANVTLNVYGNSKLAIDGNFVESISKNVPTPPGAFSVSQQPHNNLGAGGKFGSKFEKSPNNDHTGLGPSSSSGNGGQESYNMCAGCNCKILDRYMLGALDKLWHEDCLKCDACGCRLAEVNKSLFVKCGKIYCHRDYYRLFGAKGTCSVCNRAIPAFELVMRANANVYHLECFGCQECNLRFCVGDTFYLDTDNNKILCEYDYHERLYFAQVPHFSYNSLAQLKRQISQVDDYDEMQGMLR